MARRALGRGLDSLLPPDFNEARCAHQELKHVSRRQGDNLGVICVTCRTFWRRVRVQGVSRLVKDRRRFQ